MASAVARGVPVRLIGEPTGYRNPKRVWDAWNVDRMWQAGVKIRMRAPSGLSHQKSILHGLHTVIFGSSNWSSPSDHSQQEHHYFVNDKAWTVTWFDDQFDRKWNNSTGAAETKAFTPLPPDTKYKAPSANGATGRPRTAKLVWYGGPWAHYHEIYFGTSSTPPANISGRARRPRRPRATRSRSRSPRTWRTTSGSCRKQRRARARRARPGA